MKWIVNYLSFYKVYVYGRGRGCYLKGGGEEVFKLWIIFFFCVNILIRVGKYFLKGFFNLEIFK